MQFEIKASRKSRNVYTHAEKLSLKADAPGGLESAVLCRLFDILSRGGTARLAEMLGAKVETPDASAPSPDGLAKPEREPKEQE